MKNYFILTIIITTVLSILLIYSTLGLAKMKKNYAQAENIIIEQTDMIYTLTDFIKVSNKHNKTKLSNCQLFNLKTKDSVLLYTLLNGKSNYLIYKFLETNCGSCNQKQINALEYFKDFENVIIISNISSVRELKLFLSQNNILFPVYFMKQQEKLFMEDNSDKIQVIVVNNDKMILKTYTFDENNLNMAKILFPCCP